MDAIFSVIPSVLMITSPVLITAAGGMICERSGILNIALEGLMGMGAFAAAASYVLLEQTTDLSVPAALTLAALSGLLLSVIHACASISLNADQTVSGTGINILSNGLTMFMTHMLFNSDRTAAFRMGIKALARGVYPTALIAVIVVVLVWFLLYRLPFGLRLRACGENPAAAAAAGVNVVKIRYFAVLASGFLSGLSGGCLVLTETIQFTPMTINGTGYIALAAVSFGRWRPAGITGASLLFGATLAFSVAAQNIDFLKNSIPSEAFSLSPYLITLLALVAFGGKNHAPRAAGKIWRQSI